MRFKAIIVFLIALIPTAMPASAAPQRHVLKNGLKVVIEENHEAPVVCFQVWVRAGSAFERKGEYGITHLIEHMIFKGTPQDPQGKMAGRIEALGGEVNAYTSFDHTNYYVSAASRHAPEVLGLLADAVVNAQFDPKELKREKEVVIEEIRMNADEPRRRRSWAMLKLAFGDYPYGRPVLGTPESVRAITRQDILDYRARWYRAENMLVIAVGDFKTKDILARLEKAFAGLPRGKAPDFKLPPIKTADGPRLLVMREKVRQASVLLAWRIPGLPHEDVYAMDMAASVAGEGQASRLYRDLKEKRGLVDGVSASAWTPAGTGLFEVSASAAPDKIAGVWRPLVEKTLSLVSRPPRPTELQRARVNLTAEFLRERQTMSGQAGALGYFEMMRGGFEKAADYIDRFKAVTADQVGRAVRTYFTPQRLSVVIQIPRDAPAPDQKELARAVRRISAAIKLPPPAAEKAVMSKLANGLTLIVQPRRALPLVSFTLVAPGGQEAQGPDQAGLYNLWSRTITRGAAGRTHRELVDELESMAAGLDAFSGKSSCGLSGSFLAGDWRRGLELAAQTWLRPDFPPEQIKRAKREQLAALRARNNSPAARAFMAFRKLIYGDHPYAQDPLGTPQVVQALTRDDLLAAHRKIMGPGGLVLAVVGDVDPDQVRREVERLLGRARGRAFQARTPMLKPLGKPRMQKIADPKAKQTQIVLGFAAPSSLDPGRYAMEALEAVLGGHGGRLFSDLRDKRSLAYVVQPFYSPAPHAGVFGVYMAVGPGKEKQALAGLTEHLQAIRQKAPTASEVERARSYLIGGQAIGLQSNAALASVMALDQLRGLGYDNYKKVPERMAAVTPEQILAEVKKYLQPSEKAELIQGRSE